MSNAKYTPRHRKAHRPMAPIISIADAMTSMDISPVRGTAAISVTGLALTAVVAPVVNAAPSHDVARTEEASLTTTATVEAQVNAVSVPDIAWVSSDEIAVSATAPEAEEVEAPAEEEAANRSEERTELSEQTVRNYEVAINAAGGDIVSIASNLLGIPYVYGGSTPAGFDCSGFTQYVYAAAGISIPRTSYEQGMAGTFIPASEARPGDIVWEPGHVGIYAGNGMVMEATLPGDVTQLRPITGGVQFVRY